MGCGSFELNVMSLFFSLSTVPGPPFLSVNQNSETTAIIRWQPPDYVAPGLEVQGYRLQFGRKDVSPLATLEFGPQELEYSISSIHRGATYVFKVSAKSKSGFGEEASQELRVPEEVPRGYPQITEGSNITCCSVQFSWLPPVLAERNGAITEYTLSYQEAGTISGPKELRLAANENNYILNSLKPNAVYDVKIRAHTSVGPGPYSPPIQYRTVAYEAGKGCSFPPPQGTNLYNASTYTRLYKVLWEPHTSLTPSPTTR